MRGAWEPANESNTGVTHYQLRKDLLNAHFVIRRVTTFYSTFCLATSLAIGISFFCIDNTLVSAKVMRIVIGGRVMPAKEIKESSQNSSNCR